MLKALNTVLQGVVRINNKVNDTEVLTRKRRNRTVFTPVLVITRPSGRWKRAGPGVMNIAGKIIMPVKNGRASQTRLIRMLAGMAENHARMNIRK
jgi:hypothetical protein